MSTRETEGRRIVTQFYDDWGMDEDALAAAVDKAIADEREQCAKVVENFEDWVRCTCSECKADAHSHAVKTEASLSRLAETIRTATW